MMSRALTLACLLSLGGCALGPTPSAGNASAAVSRPVPSGIASGQVSVPTAPSNGATSALLAQSRSERQAGDLGDAAATIERALAIAPEDALLWVELAEIHRDQGDRDRAEEMARKALTLASANSAVADRARRLIGR